MGVALPDGAGPVGLELIFRLSAKAQRCPSAGAITPAEGQRWACRPPLTRPPSGRATPMSHRCCSGWAVNRNHGPSMSWQPHPWATVAVSQPDYSDAPARHDAITRRRGSHSRTLANIREAVTRSIPLRVGIVDLGDGQRAAHARAQMEAIGVTSIGTDNVRQLGRAARANEPDASQLCGRCGDGCLAISPEGTVWPCVFSRWLPVGNVREAPLRNIATGRALTEAMAELREIFRAERPCVPRMCDPQCGPNCSPTCNPQKCTPTCRPQYSADPCTPTRDCNPNECRPSK